MKVLFLTITLGLITALQAQDPLLFPLEKENVSPGKGRERGIGEMW